MIAKSPVGRFLRWVNSAGENSCSAPLLAPETPAKESLELRKARNQRIRQELVQEQTRRIESLERAVAKEERKMVPGESGAVLFCNFTSSPKSISFHALAGLIMSWSLRLAGQRVVHLVCNHGMAMCPQGTDPGDHNTRPPCDTCFSTRKLMYAQEHSHYIDTSADMTVKVADLKRLTLSDLVGFTFDNIKYGEICLPSVRWALRKGRLVDDAATRHVYAEYLASAMHITKQTQELLKRVDIRKAVIFNGTFFPEAAVRQVLMSRGIPIISYEAGFKQNSIFLSHALSTLYRLNIPEDFVLTAKENEELNQYLSARASGQFSMGGIKFWPEMRSMAQDLLDKCQSYGRVVTVFTNVIYDTSQTYANVAFADMFEWLDCTLELAAKHQDTLFIIRAHPDEARPRHESRESVADYLKSHVTSSLENIVFIGPLDFVSSYELLQSSRFCIVYNGTIGVESSMMGIPVVAGGFARYQDAEVTFQPDTKSTYCDTVERLLEGPSPTVPDDVKERARRYFYYSVFRAGLDFSAFIERVGDSPVVMPTCIDASALHPSQSEEMGIVHRGVNDGASCDYPCLAHGG